MSTYTGSIQVGDVIQRRKKDYLDQLLADRDGEFGIVIARSMQGKPKKPCLDVSWSKRVVPVAIGEIYVEVVCKSET